jgi:S1-C subfamily serine protease
MLRFAGLCAVALITGLAASEGWAQDAPPKVVTFDRLVIDVPKDKPVGVERRNPLCGGQGKKSFSDGARVEVDAKEMVPLFRSAFKAAGLHPDGEVATNLFDTDGASSAQYILRGSVRDVFLDACYPQVFILPPGAPYPSPAAWNDLIKGDLKITVNWQLYSRLQNKVIYQKDVESAISQKTSMRGGPSHLMELAFAENIKLLAADPGLQAELAGPGLTKNQLIEPERQLAIALEGTKNIQPRALGEAAGSVMVIYAGDALGSGVLISRDGYILTDAHVVGAFNAVRLRWSDGKEATAQVVRVSTARDVALLKTDAGGRNPLPIQDTPPPVGSTVYAMGSPEGDEFQGTLTRGVVSAIRPLNGLNYIQSDVTTGHGGSGGPLLDDKGYVIGLTDLGIGHSETSSGLNFFTPIKDLVAFLALDLR